VRAGGTRRQPRAHQGGLGGPALPGRRRRAEQAHRDSGRGVCGAACRQRGGTQGVGRRPPRCRPVAGVLPCCSARATVLVLGARARTRGRASRRWARRSDDRRTPRVYSAAGRGPCAGASMPTAEAGAAAAPAEEADAAERKVPPPPPPDKGKEEAKLPDASDAASKMAKDGAAAGKSRCPCSVP